MRCKCLASTESTRLIRDGEMGLLGGSGGVLTPLTFARHA